MTTENEKTNRAARALDESESELLNADSFKKALKLRRSLKDYSLRNLWLIYTQCPHATLVAGYQQWLSKNRQVRKGEKSIAICAPLTKKNNEGDYEILGFKTASVFDVTQTSSETDDPVLLPQDPTATNESILCSLSTLDSFCQSQKINVTYQRLERASGIYSKTSGIILNNTLPAEVTLKTFIYQLAQALLTMKEETAAHVQALEVETCACLVCDSLGLDTSSFSFSYLEQFSHDPRMILAVAQGVCKVADLLVQTIQDGAQDAPPTYLKAA
jgi:N-terminal domain of anti-restriction factor ArdC